MDSILDPSPCTPPDAKQSFWSALLFPRCADLYYQQLWALWPPSPVWLVCCGKPFETKEVTKLEPCLSLFSDCFVSSLLRWSFWQRLTIFSCNLWLISPQFTIPLVERSHFLMHQDSIMLKRVKITQKYGMTLKGGKMWVNTWQYF